MPDDTVLTCIFVKKISPVQRLSLIVMQFLGTKELFHLLSDICNTLSERLGFILPLFILFFTQLSLACGCCLGMPGDRDGVAARTTTRIREWPRHTGSRVLRVRSLFGYLWRNSMLAQSTAAPTAAPWLCWLRGYSQGRSYPEGKNLS